MQKTQKTNFDFPCGSTHCAQCVDLVLEGVGKSKNPNFMGIMHISGSVGMSWMLNYEIQLKMAILRPKNSGK